MDLRSAVGGFRRIIDLVCQISSAQVAAKIELQQGKAVWVPSGGAAVW